MPQDKYPVFASVTNRVLMKNRLISAQKGYRLLKRKFDAMNYKVNVLNARSIQVNAEVKYVMKNAIISVSEAQYLGLNVQHLLAQASEKAFLTVRSTFENIAGVKLPQFYLVDRGSNAFPFAGLSRGGEKITVVRNSFRTAVQKLVEWASLKSSLTALQLNIKKVNVRMNSIEHVIVPRMEATIHYIDEELQERDREEFFRLKKVKTKKLKMKRQKEAELLLAQELEISDLLYSQESGSFSALDVNRLSSTE